MAHHLWHVQFTENHNTMLSQKQCHMRTAFQVWYYSTITYRMLTFFITNVFVKHWTSVPVCEIFFMSVVSTRPSDHTWSSCLNSERVRWPFFVEFQRYQHIISSKKSQQPSASNIGGISNILLRNHRNFAHKIKAVPSLKHSIKLQWKLAILL